MKPPKAVQTAEDGCFGYRHLDPIPSAEELNHFFLNQNYASIMDGQRAPDLRRLLGGGAEADQEREWLESTLYTDIRLTLERFAPGRRCLDVGCGTGAFLAYLKQHGFAVAGTEPGPEGARAAQAMGLEVYPLTFEQLAETLGPREESRFDSITFLGVLEHLPNPVATIELAAKLLTPGGVLGVRGNNEFSVLQRAAREKLGTREWWVVPPDHINYFNLAAMNKILAHAGLEVVYSQGDFPMEIFLLFGDDYVSDRAVGAACHRKRRAFELSIPGDLRRRIYQALASQGVGRTFLTFGKLPL
jgi:2-polyprenyl-3-methyl-5-hydroxy-6-metoxy-1,4-benzoquinol methylase